LEFSSSCAAVPELAAPRKYEVTLEAASPYQYLGMRISGGGYTSPTIVGDLWPSADGRFAQISWNNFDIGGCDGTPEPMPAGRALMVCGDGGSTVNDRTVLANMNANLFIEAGGQRQKVCGGTQRFTLQRLPRSALKGLEPFSVVNGSVVRPAAQTRFFGNGSAAALRYAARRARRGE
jgi:hypothetical protein